VAQVFHLALSQHTLLTVEHHTMLLQSGEDGAKILHVLSVAPARHQDVIHVDENVLCLLKDLEGLASISEPKRHPQVLKQAKGGDHSAAVLGTSHGWTGTW